MTRNRLERRVSALEGRPGGKGSCSHIRVVYEDGDADAPCAECGGKPVVFRVVYEEPAR